MSGSRPEITRARRGRLYLFEAHLNPFPLMNIIGRIERENRGRVTGPFRARAACAAAVREARGDG